MRIRRLSRAARAAFTLVEVSLAIGVAAFSLVAIFGLLPVGISTNEVALEQSAAGNILSAVVADLRSTPVTSPPGSATSSQQFKIAIPAAGNTSAPVSTIYVTLDGTPSTTLTASSHFLLTVTYVPPVNATSRSPTCARLTLSWPAAAGTAHSLGSVEQLAILDRN